MSKGRWWDRTKIPTIESGHKKNLRSSKTETKFRRRQGVPHLTWGKRNVNVPFLTSWRVSIIVGSRKERRDFQQRLWMKTIDRHMYVLHIWGWKKERKEKQAANMWNRLGIYTFNVAQHPKPFRPSMGQSTLVRVEYIHSSRNSRHWRWWSREKALKRLGISYVAHAIFTRIYGVGACPDSWLYFSERKSFCKRRGNLCNSNSNWDWDWDQDQESRKNHLSNVKLYSLCSRTHWSW